MGSSNHLPRWPFFSVLLVTDGVVYIINTVTLKRNTYHEYGNATSITMGRLRHFVFLRPRGLALYLFALGTMESKACTYGQA